MQVRTIIGGMLPFESTSFFPIYHNSMTNPSCYQELCLLYCTAHQQHPPPPLTLHGNFLAPINTAAAHRLCLCDVFCDPGHEFLLLQIGCLE
jgi:hypothetical protein